MTCLNDKNLAPYQKCKAVYIFFSHRKKPLSVHIANLPARKWQQTNVIRSIHQVYDNQKTKKLHGILKAKDAFHKIVHNPTQSSHRHTQLTPQLPAKYHTYKLWE